MQDYVLDIRYMADWGEEIVTELFSRRILGKFVLLTRAEKGAPIALCDRCTHRFAPLSKGRWEGGGIICRYDGLAFYGQGQCVGKPYSDRIRARASVGRYMSIEKDDIVWLWFGDLLLADRALIPDFSLTTAGPQGKAHQRLHA